MKRKLEVIVSDDDTSQHRNEDDRYKWPKRLTGENTAKKEIVDLDDDGLLTPLTNLRDMEVIDIEKLETAVEKEISELRPLAARNTDVSTQGVSMRNPPIAPPLLLIEKTILPTGQSIEVGDTVEIYGGSFLQVKAVLKNSVTKEITLRGWTLERNGKLDGQLIRNANEVCYILQVDLDDLRPTLEQSVVEVNRDIVIQRRALVRTNYPFPAHRLDAGKLPFQTIKANRRYAKDHEVLVVRWKCVTTFRSARDRLSSSTSPRNYETRSLESLSEDECDPDPSNTKGGSTFAVPHNVQRYNWRGHTTLGGSYSTKPSQVIIEIPDDKYGVKPPHHSSSLKSAPSGRGVQIADGIEEISPQQFLQNIDRHLDSALTLRQNENGTRPFQTFATGRCRGLGLGLATVRSKDLRPWARPCKQKAAPVLRSKEKAATHQYTYADAFCGAGGMTRGAVMAGLKVKWGLDFNPNAVQTWKANFPEAVMYQKWAHEVCGLLDRTGELIVDILHLSPPCQVYSPAHTRDGKDDDMNSASLFAVQALIAKAKPRIVTLEQTFGILHDQFQPSFNALIRMFTDSGFSVSWKVMELQRFGLPQRRKRLIIIAAGPGETLPPFPRFTHSDTGGNGLKAYTSARSAMATIPRNAPNHDVSAAGTRGHYVPWDDSTIIPNCITTGGANGRGHPSGQRGLTCREVASLQTFPHDHVFLGAQVMRQIGNAVPPLIGKIVLACAREHLEKSDTAEKKRLGGLRA